MGGGQILAYLSNQNSGFNCQQHFSLTTCIIGGKIIIKVPEVGLQEKGVNGIGISGKAFSNTRTGYVR